MTEPTQEPPTEEQQSPYPVGGAGIFDVDPSQDDVSQSPAVTVDGDVQALPEDEEF
ncbi:hypothetical protein SUDANB15_00277 [Streptomyces sp. enrichment culture]|uniref:hypothetical protein n=1 Tax=Streptomyces sp. enrichment culture TaxID=1795815 RepID=UPI003F56EBF7